jgi:hypothetical protein
MVRGEVTGWFDLLWREAARGLGSSGAELLGRWALTPAAAKESEGASCPACECKCSCLSVSLELTLAVGGGVLVAFVVGVLVGRLSARVAKIQARRVRDDRVLFHAAELR